MPADIPPAEIDVLAHRAAIDAVMHPGDYPSRSSAGDCLVGALAAGATLDRAREVAVAIHTDPELVKQIPQGALRLGAYVYLEGKING